MNLTPEEKEIGRENYYDAVGVTRRDFLVANAIGAATVGAGGLGAAYFQYGKISDPLRVAVIGTGDEGQVLINAFNPNYIQTVAICDIRPFNIHRAFHGDHAGEVALANRCGLLTKYSWKSEDEARRNVKVYQEIDECLADSAVEAVIIALPLHLHAPIAIQAMQAGKHVLTEKLMAHNIAQCKVMGRFANDNKLVLAVGHQRHYSVLYDNAVNLIQQGLLGELHHIRAQWHRQNLPGKDSWQQPLPGGEMGWVKGKDGTLKPGKVDPITSELKKMQEELKRIQEDVVKASPAEYDSLTKRIAQWQAWQKDAEVDAAKYGYQQFSLGGRQRTPLEELCRWRLFTRTGGGLMAELGSHQLDAASIFCSSFMPKGQKAHPLSVHAVGGRHTFAEDRHAEDHVYCMFEFPNAGYDFDKLRSQGRMSTDAKHYDKNENFVGYWDPAMNYPNEKGVAGYEQDSNHKVVVTYSSINGNGFGGYGEVVMGTKGTIVLERESEVMLYKDAATTTRVGVKADKGGPTLDTQASGKGPTAVAKTVETGPVSKGYTEEIEHWAYCIRNRSEENVPRCRAEVAMGDAIIALTTNVAIRLANEGKGGYVKFNEEWFDLNNDATPDGSSYEQEKKNLKA